MSSSNPIPVAVIGLGALFPGSVDSEGFWRNILAGADLIGPVPEERWRAEDYFDADPSATDKTYAARGGFLDKTAFDAMQFGVPPNLIEATDTSQLLALIVAQQVLDDAARGQFATLDREKISVILGVTSGQELMIEMASRLQRPVWQKALREVGIPENDVQAACDRIANHYVGWQEGTFPGLLGNVVAGRIANRFDLGGTNCVTDAACASTLSALSMGLHELWTGDSDVVIAGGVDTFNDVFMYMCFSKTPALSKSGDCRPFSDAADGTLLGEGLAMFALKRLEDAERDGDEIYAVIRGIGSSSDGRSKSIYAPVSDGQAKALRRAYERAGYGPETVELVEAHGTGTKAGDAAEFEGLRTVFSETSDARQWCALGTVKSQVGHTKAAAGGAGLFKVVMALHHGVLPPTIKVDRPNPRLAIDESPFYLNTASRPWIRGSDHPRRGSVSAFGFGGSNFHTTVEEYRGPLRKPRYMQSPAELVLVDAETIDQLEAACDELRTALEAETRLERVARRTQLEFEGRHVRLAIVAEDVDDLRRKLTQATDAVRNNPPDTAFELPNGIYLGFGPNPGKVAFVFPGQGSQFAGMGSDHACNFESARAVWDRAADVELGDRPLHRVVFPVPAFTDAEREAQDELLRQTEWAQPALGAASLATLAVLRELGLDADLFAGHSFGEITALCAAGVVDEATALRIARRRGELMAKAARTTQGAMTAVQMNSQAIDEFLTANDLDVRVANYNSPKQVVLSGTIAAIEAAEALLAEQGIVFTRLNVSTAFHSEIVESSVAPFREFLEDLDFSGPAQNVRANVTAVAYPDAEAERKALLASQIASPVQFESMIHNLVADGVRTLVEVGPGTVLTRLMRRVASNEVAVIATDAKGRDAVSALWHAVARLAARGLRPDFTALWERRHVPPAPPEPPRLAVDIWGGNHNRPYPPAAGTALPQPNPPRPTPASSPARAAAHTPVPPMKDDDKPKPAAPATPTRQAPDPTWVHAFSESQRQMAEAHVAYQQAMAQTHTSFLQALSASQANLAAMLNGTGAQVAPQFTAPQYAPAPVITAPVQTAPVPTYTPPAPPMPAPMRPVPAPVATAPPAPQPAAKAAAPAVDLEKLLVDIVADKTGYPSEMLTLDMQLESDLGIDSIKRVEILSAVNEAAPHLPGVEGTQMAQMQTLQEILDLLGDHGQSTTVPTVAPTSPASVTPLAPAKNGAISLEGVLLTAVAEKTGYPEEMLDLDMQLEADLGIDSIKRVEILSAVNDALPNLPEVDGSEMAGLATLREIVDFMSGDDAQKKNGVSL